jgi:hypothetical protein
MNPKAALRVFVSYTHDSPTHKATVAELAGRLRGDGVDAWIDQYEVSPPEGWPTWMLQQIQSADFVLVVCTETYKRRAEKREQPGLGRGATWEGGIITLELYEASFQNTKFIPVVFHDSDLQHVVVFLRGSTHYCYPQNYDALFRHITGQPEMPAPPVGLLRPMPPRPAPPVAPRVVGDAATAEPPQTTKISMLPLSFFCYRKKGTPRWCRQTRYNPAMPSISD